MNNFFERLGEMVIGVAIALASVMGIVQVDKSPENLGASIPTPVAVFETRLAASIGANDTTMTLASATDVAGNTLASSTYGFVIDEGTATEEFVLANCTGTACTGMIRGVSPTTGNTSVTSLKKAHRRGASIKITDAPLLLVLTRIVNGSETLPNVLSYDTNINIATSSNQLVHSNYLANNYVNKSTNESIDGTKTFVKEILAPTPTASTSVATKGYVDGIAIAGSPNASTSTKGIVQEAVLSDITSGNATGTTGARLYINPSYASTTGANKLVLTDSNGKLNGSLVAPHVISISRAGVQPYGSYYFDNFDTIATRNGGTIYLETPSKFGLQTRVLTSDWASGTDTRGSVVIGSYMYAIVGDGLGTYRVYRYLTSDLSAGGTQMTFSGQTMGTSGGADVQMTSDGTFFYFNYKAGNSANDYVISKYSLSGTTFTYIGDITCGSSANTMRKFGVDTAGNLIGLSDSDAKLRKYNSSGTLTATAQTGYNGNEKNAIVNYAGIFYMQLYFENQYGLQKINI